MSAFNKGFVHGVQEALKHMNYNSIEFKIASTNLRAELVRYCKENKCEHYLENKND